MIAINRNRMMAVAAGLAATFTISAQKDYIAESHEAFLNYDFDLASELLDKYEKILEKKPDAQGEKSLEKMRRQLDIAESSLENVQKIEIIGRLDVPLAEFVASIAMPANSSYLLGRNQVPDKGNVNNSDFVYATPYGDFRLWTTPDETGKSHLVESSRLTDGSWETHIVSGDLLNDGGNVKNPFMLSDGTTLYFASDGEGSMGDYDLFVASKNPSTGEYLQPTGLGYPFNSPFNEYMIAIDDENGIGWWVTDRNQIPGKVSVYIFKTNKVRKNYNSDDEEDIVALAKVEDITLTQNPDTDYDKMMAEIIGRTQAEGAGDEDPGLNFRMPGNRLVREMSDLKSPTARRNLTVYLNAQEEYKSNLEKLSALRKKYNKDKAGRGVSQAVINQIKDLEKVVDTQRDKLKTMRNAVISAELKK